MSRWKSCKVHVSFTLVILGALVRLICMLCSEGFPRMPCSYKSRLNVYFPVLVAASSLSCLVGSILITLLSADAATAKQTVQITRAT